MRIVSHNLKEFYTCKRKTDTVRVGAVAFDSSYIERTG